eukprot:gene12592-16885_t
MKRKVEDIVLVEEDDQYDVPDVSALSNNKIKCPYLDTINRTMLDFDAQKICSISLTAMNVYACLVCGKFFMGRGSKTPAFTHSVAAGHFVFLHLRSGRAFCLPDNYEIIDTSLTDIVKCLAPTFTSEEIDEIDSNTSLSRDIHGVSYLPGFIGINNLNTTDYLNVVMHGLSHVVPFRNFWLNLDNYSLSKSQIVHHFGLFMRKMWSPNNFKSTVSPQELIQEITVLSKKRFAIGHRSECIELFLWLLSVLNSGISSNKRSDSPSPLYEPFQGLIEVISATKKLVDKIDVKDISIVKNDEMIVEADAEGWIHSTNIVPFTYLSLDIPPCPLFRDSHGGLIIPQIPIFELLKKFDGMKWADTVTKEAHVRKQYRIQRLPQYLVLHLARFTKNNFNMEKNPTIITFPVKNLEMREYLSMIQPADRYDSLPDIESIADMSLDESVTVGDINMGNSMSKTSTKESQSRKVSSVSTSNDVLGQGVYKIHTQNRSTGQWFEIQDLRVVETTPQLVGISESNVLIYEKKNDRK